MKGSAPRHKATTQHFTQIENIVESFVFLHGGRAASVVEITATNFALSSEQEQQVLISEYASFLNSLSFPVQILIRSKKLDISSYLKNLEMEAQKSQNPQLKNYIEEYKNFVSNLLKTRTVLDKKFYIVIPFSTLELGPTGASGSHFEDMKKGLISKQAGITAGLKRMGLRFKLLEKEELMKLFYEIYNNQTANDVPLVESVETPVVKAKL